MHVYMEDGDRKRWTDVYLRDGFCPFIGGLNDRLLSDVSPMEPAIWCKVLVLDSVSIQCNKRLLSWSTGRPSEDYDSPNQYCINECSGYDTEDELFDLARTIINKSSQEYEDPTDDDFKMCLLRMLHCFVLPRVTFQKNDQDKVEQAKEKQIQHITELDSKIKQQCMDLSDKQDGLDLMREQFLPCLEQMLDKHQCSKGFVETLLEDLKLEEHKIRQEIDRAQDTVESAKAKVAANENVSANGHLYQAREERNSFQSKLELILTARETLSDSWEELHDLPEGPRHAILQDYLEKRTAMLGLKEHRNKLIQQKNCALSVREMLDEILDDLTVHGVSEANTADSKGARATDVLQNVWYPEWQKLSERVATIVYNSEHPVGMCFVQFTAEIRAMCQDLIQLGTLSNDDESYPHRVGSFENINHIRKEDQLGGSYDMFGLNDFLLDPYRDQLIKIREAITGHFSRMTGLLSEQFNCRDSLFRNKLRLAYEQCFYESEHSFIECVYELAHHEHVAGLENDVRRLKKLPIKLLKLQMKDEWWHEIFEQRVRIESLNLQVLKPLAENGCLPDTNGVNSVDGTEDVVETDDDLGLDTIDVGFPLTKDTKSFADSVSIRSYIICTVRDRSRTFNYELSSDESDHEDGNAITRNKGHNRSNSCGSKLSTSAPQTKSNVSLGYLIDQCERKETKPLKGTSSKSYSTISHTNKSQTSQELDQGDTFEDHFGPALQHMKDLFKATSPLSKLKCLTAALRKITATVSELRSRKGGDSFSNAVTAEDLLPLLILMMLQMEPCDAASMWPQLALLEDLMAPCLASGCHGWALVEFQIAQRILTELCSQF